MVRRRPWQALLLIGVLVVSPGCRSIAKLTYEGYYWSNSSFTPNPIAMPAYFLGLGLGFIAALPLCLISWPATLLGYPEEDGGEFFITGALAPAVAVGTFVGTVLGAPFYPFGYPWVPDDEEAPAGPGERGPR